MYKRSIRDHMPGIQLSFSTTANYTGCPQKVGQLYTWCPKKQENFKTAEKCAYKVFLCNLKKFQLKIFLVNFDDIGGVIIAAITIIIK